MMGERQCRTTTGNKASNLNEAWEIGTSDIPLSPDATEEDNKLKAWNLNFIHGLA
jgi:hypothetical protein